MEYFFLDESPLYKGRCVIRLNHDKFCFPNGTLGSYNVFVARVANLSWTDYLRYARDRLGAELVGKGKRYVVPYYEDNKTTRAFVHLLNRRMDYIMKEHKDPAVYLRNHEGKVERIEFNGQEN